MFNIVNNQKTKELVTSFYYDCFRFWQREGKDSDEAKRLAIVDCEKLKHDPYVPCGDTLDMTAKEECIEKLRQLEDIV